MEFSTFTSYAAKIEKESSDHEKVSLVSKLLAESGDSIDISARFIQGRVFPNWDERKLDIGPSMMYSALSKASNNNEKEIEELVAEVGGIGTACDQIDFSDSSERQQQLTDISKQKPSLTLQKIQKTFTELSNTSGTGSTEKKTKIIENAILSCKNSLEAKYLSRLLLREMRIGVGEGTVRDAISSEFEIPVNEVERALMVTNDTGKVAKIAREEGEKGLKELEMKLGRPVKPMKAKAGKTEEVITATTENSEKASVEYKFDGIRLQIHKDGDSITLFTRKMKDVTDSLPDVVSIVENNVDTDEAILDAEVVAYPSKEHNDPLPFQEVMKRVGRKYDVNKKTEEIFLNIHVFDIIYHQSKNLLSEPYLDRRDLLERTCDASILAQRWEAETQDDLYKLRQKSISEGNEGIMVKDPTSKYSPGNRGKDWMKLKPEVETVDCVVVGGEWGEGKRTQMIGAYTIAVKDASTGEFKTIGKVATGITEEKLESLTERFKPLITSEDGKTLKFKPEIVFEVGGDEIQKSPTYTSGYAIRFPRFIGVREDKTPDDIDTISRVKEIKSKLE